MLSTNIQKLIPKIKEFLSTQPISRAWIFGSCSRGEEQPDSDIDILVDYDCNKRISLLTVAKIMCDLEDIIHRRVDLVENGRLKPFAIPTVERDKILIYERKSAR